MKLRPSADLRRALAGFLWKAMSSPLERACRLLVILVAAPALGATSFGAYQYASTVTAMLAAGTELGLGTWTTRTLARDPERARETMQTGLWLRTAAVLLYLVLLGLVSATEADGERRLAMLVFGAAALANAFVDYFGAIFRGREEFRQEATMNATRAVSTAACALGGIYLARSLLGLAAGMTLGTVASTAWSLWFLRHRYRGLSSGPREGAPPRARGIPTSTTAKSVLGKAIPLWLSGLLAMLYFRSDIVVVRAFAGDAEVGAYAAAYRIFEATLVLPSAAMAVAFPRLARAGDPGKRASRLELQLTLLLFVLGALVAAALLLANERVVGLLLGDTFARSVASLRVLALTVPVMFVSFAVCYFVIARGRERPFAKVLGAMLALNVALNLVLVPRLGGVGAAWSTLATEIVLIVACAAILTLGRSSPPSQPVAATWP